MEDSQIEKVREALEEAYKLGFILADGEPKEGKELYNFAKNKRKKEIDRILEDLLSKI